MRVPHTSALHLQTHRSQAYFSSHSGPYASLSLSLPSFLLSLSQLPAPQFSSHTPSSLLSLFTPIPLLLAPSYSLPLLITTSFSPPPSLFQTLSSLLSHLSFSSPMPHTLILLMGWMVVGELDSDSIH